MKTNEETQTRPGPGQCCAANPPTNSSASDQSGQVPAGFSRQVDWTDGLRPFLGLYVFKG